MVPLRFFKRLLDSFRVVMPHDRGITFRTELALIRRVGRIPFDLVNDSGGRYVNNV